MYCRFRHLVVLEPAEMTKPTHVLLKPSHLEMQLLPRTRSSDCLHWYCIVLFLNFVVTGWNLSPYSWLILLRADFSNTFCILLLIWWLFPHVPFVFPCLSYLSSFNTCLYVIFLRCLIISVTYFSFFFLILEMWTQLVFIEDYFYSTFSFLQVE